MFLHEKEGGDMDKKQHNKLEEIAFDFSEPAVRKIVEPVSGKQGRASKAGNSLDDILSFDAQVFVSNTAQVAHINKAGESRENSQTNSGVESNAEAETKPEVTKAPTNVIDEAICQVVKTTKVSASTDKAVDALSEFSYSEPLSHTISMEAVLPFVWDNRILQLEHEVVKQKKMLRALTEFYKQLDGVTFKYKMLSIISVFVAVNALLISVFFAVLVKGVPLEAEEFKKLVTSAYESPVILPEKRMIAEKVTSTQGLATDLDKPMIMGVEPAVKINTMDETVLSEK